MAAGAWGQPCQGRECQAMRLGCSPSPLGNFILKRHQGGWPVPRGHRAGGELFCEGFSRIAQGKRNILPEQVDGMMSNTGICYYSRIPPGTFGGVFGRFGRSILGRESVIGLAFTDRLPTQWMSCSSSHHRQSIWEAHFQGFELVLSSCGTWCPCTSGCPQLVPPLHPVPLREGPS